MNGRWAKKYKVVLRPLRERNGPTTEVEIVARTAAQASRDATARHPTLKVVKVVALGNVSCA